MSLSSCLLHLRHRSFIRFFQPILFTSLSSLLAPLPVHAAPTITEIIAFDIRSTQALIGWYTLGAPSDTQVDYGLTTAYGSSTVLDPALYTNHVQRLTGLTPNTRYHFRVRSQDATGLTVSPDQTFMTFAQPGTGVLEITVLQDTNGNGVADTGERYIRDADAPSCPTQEVSQAGFQTSYNGVQGSGGGPFGSCNSSGIPAFIADIPPGAYFLCIQPPAAGWTFKPGTGMSMNNVPMTISNGGTHTFSFAVQPPQATDTIAPVITGVVATAIGTSSAAIIRGTSELADSQVEYGLTTSYGSATPLFAFPGVCRQHVLTGLTPDTLYHYRVLSRDPAGNLRTSGDFTFRTLSTTPSFSPCDVNRDTFTNVVDVQGMVNQAIQVSPCASDINQDSSCNVVDVQRVVNAALGGQCVSP